MFHTLCNRRTRNELTGKTPGKAIALGEQTRFQASLPTWRAIPPNTSPGGWLIVNPENPFAPI